jgi:tetratricopeptide (TPR) repeat protein
MLEWIEGPRAALALYHEGVEFARRRGLAFMTMWATRSLMDVLFPLGEWDETLAVADELLEWGRDHVAGQMGYAAALEKARVLVHRGRVEEAGALLDEFLPRVRDVGDPQALVPSLYVGCLVERARGDRAAVLRLVREIGDITAQRPLFRMIQLAGLLRIQIWLGDLDEAEGFARGLSPRMARERNGLLSARAILDEARGRLERALSSYRKAADAWSEFGDEVEHAHALLGAGRCLLALAREGEAIERLREARERFASFGAVPLIAEVDDLLARATAKTSETPG